MSIQPVPVTPSPTTDEETTYPPTPGPVTDEVSSIYGHDISSLDICIVSLCVLILIIITFHYVYSARACDTISYHRWASYIISNNRHANYISTFLGWYHYGCHGSWRVTNQSTKKAKLKRRSMLVYYDGISCVIEMIVVLLEHDCREIISVWMTQDTILFM